MRRRRADPEAGGSRARRDHFVVAPERHEAGGQVEIAEPDVPVAQHEQARGGVVRDRVHDVDVPAGDPAVHDLQCGDDVRGGGGHVGGADHRSGQVVRQYEGDLGLDLGLQGACDVDGYVGRARHGVQQDAEVGLVDAQLLLHDRVGEPDLAAHDPGSGRHLALGPGGLDGVRGVQVARGQQVAHRGAGAPRRAGLAEPVQRLGGAGVECGSGYGHVSSPLSSPRRSCRCPCR
jgi:hypothetical protein